jgi:hypothetical protein
VLHTKARQEKALARDLLVREIPFYLPLISSNRFVRGRKALSYLPLFSGYAFLFGTPDERVSALTTNRISQILEVDDETQLSEDLCAVRKLIALDVPLTVENRLSAERRVRIKCGVLKGLEGVIVNRVKTYRLEIAVTYLQQGISVEIDDFMVEAI